MQGSKNQDGTLKNGTYLEDKVNLPPRFANTICNLSSILTKVILIQARQSHVTVTTLANTANEAAREEGGGVPEHA